MKIKANKNLLKLTPKKFILKHLIPFIMREEGRGFNMDRWKDDVLDAFINKEKVEFDGVERKAPACGTVACIGGSIECLTGMNIFPVGGYEHINRNAAKLLGITQEEACRLFYDWLPGEGGWPDKYAKKYDRAKTAYQKAKVACELLKEIAEKGSEAFKNPKDEL